MTKFPQGELLMDFLMWGLNWINLFLVVLVGIINPIVTPNFGMISHSLFPPGVMVSQVRIDDDILAPLFFFNPVIHS